MDLTAYGRQEPWEDSPPRLAATVLLHADRRRLARLAASVSMAGRTPRPPSGRDWKPDTPTTSAPAMTAARTTAAAALTATLGLAAACWVVSVWQMTGMDMGW